MTIPELSHESPGTADEHAADSRDDTAADPGICPWCRQQIPEHSGRGRPRVWCSDQCRRDAHSARKAARAGAVGMTVIRQTRTVDKPVKVPVIEYRDPPPTVTPALYIDEHDLVLHVLADARLLAQILDSFAAGLGPRWNGRQLTGRLHESALRLAPLLEDYHDRVTPPDPATSHHGTAGLSRQQRRAKQRLHAKNNRP